MFRERLAVAVMVSVLVGSSSVLANERADEALAFVVEHYGGQPDQWQLVESADGRATDLELDVWSAKFLNASTRQVAGVVDLGGRLMTDSEFLKEVAQAREDLSPFERKADQALRERVAAGSDGATLVPVGIWLAADSEQAAHSVLDTYSNVERLGDRVVTSDPLLAAKVENEISQSKRDLFAGTERPVVTALKGLGAEIEYEAEAAPLIFARVPVNSLAAVAAMSNVTDIGLEGTWELAMDHAGPTVDANWTSGSGDQGTGVRVGVVEYDNVRNTGDLAGKVAASHSTTGTLTYSGHPDWVAGAIVSQDSTFKGIAPGAVIVSSGTGGYVCCSLAQDNAVIAAADWALSPTGGAAPIINLSLVQDTSQGSEIARKYFDSVQWEGNDLVVAATGNLGQCANENVGSPATGWNVLAVGGINDHNTTAHSDNTIWYKESDTPTKGACWRDPSGTAWNPHGDFNKPQVSAPARDVETANGHRDSGTSVASPIVAGIAAQLQARDPAYLESWPEAIKALIMAGATYKTQMPNGGYDSDHEGVGTVSAKWANKALVDGGGTYGGVMRIAKSTSSDIVKYVSVTAGQRVQVAVVWSSHTSGGGSTDTLTADFDLTLYEPNGTHVGSYTWDNAYEYADFIAPTTGGMTIVVHPFRMDAGTEYLALAWSKH